MYVIYVMPNSYFFFQLQIKHGIKRQNLVHFTILLLIVYYILIMQVLKWIPCIVDYKNKTYHRLHDDPFVRIRQLRSCDSSLHNGNIWLVQQWVARHCYSNRVLLLSGTRHTYEQRARGNEGAAMRTCFLRRRTWYSQTRTSSQHAILNLDLLDDNALDGLLLL